MHQHFVETRVNQINNQMKWERAIKTTDKLIIFNFTLLALATSAYAERHRKLVAYSVVFVR